jgi:hypothetical protein
LAEAQPLVKSAVEQAAASTTFEQLKDIFIEVSGLTP